jgi:hypothetical protein
MSTTSTVFAFNLAPHTGTPNIHPTGSYDAANQVWVGATEVAQIETCTKLPMIWEEAKYCFRNGNTATVRAKLLKTAYAVCANQGYNGVRVHYCANCWWRSTACFYTHMENLIVKVTCYCKQVEQP